MRLCYEKGHLLRRATTGGEETELEPAEPWISGTDLLHHDRTETRTVCMIFILHRPGMTELQSGSGERMPGVVVG